MGFGKSTKQLYVCGHIVGEASAQPIYKEARRVQAQRTASNQPQQIGENGAKSCSRARCQGEL